MVSTPPAIQLTPLQEADLPVLHEWINDRELVELSSAFKPVSAAEHRHWFDTIRNRADTRIFAIRPQGEATLLGTCQLLKISPVEQSAELQIRIGRADARGRGLGTEAVRQLVAYGFDTLGLRRIALHVFATNIAAQRAYEKAGFVREGVQQDAAMIGGKAVDAVLMAIVK